MLEALKKTGERGKDALRDGLQAAQEAWDDTERAIRQRMRIYPALANDSLAHPSAHQLLRRRTIVRTERTQCGLDGAQRRPIVSIHGRDLSEDEL